MKLRTVTIWTNWLLLLVTVITPLVYFHAYEFRMSEFTIKRLLAEVYIFLIIWVFTSSPLVISCGISSALKHPVSLVILLISTIVYGFWFIFGWYLVFVHYCGLGSHGISLFYIAPSSLYWMIPAWILAWKINSYHVKKTPANPGTARCSVPGSLEENGKNEMNEGNK